MDFKKVDMIELHDANVIVCKDRFDGEPGWHESPAESENERFTIYNDEILKALKINDATNVSIYREKTVIGSEEHRGFNRIKELLVKIEAPNLIHIRIVSFSTSWIEGRSRENNYTNDITYSGSYTVWWAGDENGSSSL